MKGYLDRFIDNTRAVIIVEEEKRQYTIPNNELPTGAQIGSWLHLKIENNIIKQMTLLDDLTEEKKNQTTDLLTKLRAKNRQSSFKK